MNCIYCDKELTIEELLGFQYIYCCGYVQTEEQRAEFLDRLYLELIRP